ncbi:hypothetical protein [Bacillus cereus]|uniref:hypothetical protein n=1 Tax=Bacillus cereus TaxID=1396 RepID=UPI0009BFD03F|nr:hypothetical protein [Bacillus cereus]
MGYWLKKYKEYNDHQCQDNKRGGCKDNSYDSYNYSYKEYYVKECNCRCTLKPYHSSNKKCNY